MLSVARTASFSTALVCRGFSVRVKQFFSLCPVVQFLCPVVELLACCFRWNVKIDVFVCLRSRKEMGRWMPLLSVALGLLAALLTCCYAEGESSSVKKNQILCSLFLQLSVKNLIYFFFY